jgi:hypothetical protein
MSDGIDIEFVRENYRKMTDDELVAPFRAHFCSPFARQNRRNKAEKSGKKRRTGNKKVL